MSIPRTLKWLLIFLSVRLAPGGASADELRLGPFEKTSPRELVIATGSEPFDAREALHGSFSSPAQCKQVPNGLWVEVDGKGDCIRYYAHGLEAGRTPRALVYFGGDAILRTSRGVRFIGESYREASPDGLRADMTEWSRQAGVPAIYLARPGLYGSSGDHNMRRYPREVALMNGALEEIKKRYQITDFVLAGQSGGGHIVASLLNKRQDISAAVISSGLVSVRQVAKYWERLRKVPDTISHDLKAFYDPIDQIDRIPTDPAPRIYVISDPEDRIVPFFSQLRYVRLLRAAGHDPQHFYAHASDRNRHVLFRSARLAGALLAENKSTRCIWKALDDLELEKVK